MGGYLFRRIVGGVVVGLVLFGVRYLVRGY